jgi:hypothetical protein
MMNPIRFTIQAYKDIRQLREAVKGLIEGLETCPKEW